MKQVALLMTAFFFLLKGDAQITPKSDVKDTHDRYTNTDDPSPIRLKGVTSKLPKGTSFRKGKVVLLKGYRVKYHDSSQVTVVYRQNLVTGAFTCGCQKGTTGGGSCLLQTSGNVLSCTPNSCTNCKLVTTIDTKTGVAITKANADWKEVVLPTAGKQQKTEDPDQGGEIFKKSDKKVKQ